ncbi:MAG: NAD-dependent epimerase/dehydratase family protein [Gemmatimonadaceae bacterium]
MPAWGCGRCALRQSAAQEFDVVVHLAGIRREEPPEQRFARINVEGTRHVLTEARRAGVTRVVYMSSLGAEKGQSSYHGSKVHAEDLVRGFGGVWTILRPGNVYGPGVGTIALFLRLVRTFPFVPAIGYPDIRFQPICVGDLAEAVARIVERDDLAGRSLELADDDTTSQRELFERLRELKSRTPPLVVLPGRLVSAGARLLEWVHITPPITEDQVTMFKEWNVLPADGRNELRDELGVAPLPLKDGMELLAYTTPEQLPSHLTGTLMRRRFWIDMEGSTMSEGEVMSIVQRDFAQLLPIGTASLVREELSSSIRVVESVCKRAGGRAVGGMQRFAERLDLDQGEATDACMERLVQRREVIRHEQRSPLPSDGPSRRTHVATSPRSEFPRR